MRVIESVNGVKVVSQQVAEGPHPHPAQGGRIVPFENVTHLLLENGTELYACGVCSETYNAIRSTVGHLASHFKTPGPATDAETIKKVIMAVRAVPKQHTRERFKIAAQELNRHGVKTFHGNDWTTGSIRNIFIRYDSTIPQDEVPTRRSSRRTSPRRQLGDRLRFDSTEPVIKLKSEPKSEPESELIETLDVDDVVRRLMCLSDAARTATNRLNSVAMVWDSFSDELTKIIPIVRRLAEKTTPADDPALRDALSFLQRLAGENSSSSTASTS